MKQIVHYLRDYLRTEFHLGIFFTLSLFLTFIIWANFHFEFDDVILKGYSNKSYYIVLQILNNAIPYLFACLVISGFTKDFGYFRKPGFWLIVGIYVISMSLDSVVYFSKLLPAIPAEMYSYTVKMGNKVTRIFFYLVPISIYFIIRRKELSSFFGFSKSGFSSKPYWIMTALMVPLLIWASFQPSFLRKYPTYTPGVMETYLNIPYWLSFIPYQFLYALTFMSLEILFRGFLLYEMERYLGKKVVLPMVVAYCAIHFGKPLAECISSIFGGFILGVLSIKTRSVYGGMWVHIFIAISMDMLAFLQETYWMK